MVELATATRDAAYKELRDSLGTLQVAVLNKLEMYPDGLTNLEIAAYLHKPINSITGRVYELRELGLVVPGVRRVCTTTGRMVQAWIVKPLST